MFGSLSWGSSVGLWETGEGRTPIYHSQQAGQEGQWPWPVGYCASSTPSIETWWSRLCLVSQEAAGDTGFVLGYK